MKKTLFSILGKKCSLSNLGVQIVKMSVHGV